MNREQFVEAIKSEIRSTGGSVQVFGGVPDKPMPILWPMMESIRSQMLIQGFCKHLELDPETQACLNCGITERERLQ